MTSVFRAMNPAGCGDVLDSNRYAGVGFCIYIVTYKVSLNRDAKKVTKKIKIETKPGEISIPF